MGSGSTWGDKRGVGGAMVASSFWLLLKVGMVGAAKEEEEGCRAIS